MVGGKRIHEGGWIWVMFKVPFNPNCSVTIFPSC